MPVPSTIADLSATASSNYPQGSESPSTLDDYIRAHGAIIRQVSDSLSASSGASIVGYQPSGTGSFATNVQTKLREVVSVKDFGAVGDGVTDDTAAIQSAFAHAATLINPVVYFPSGTYLVASSTSLYRLTNGMEVRGDGMDGSIIKWEATYAGSTIALFNGPASGRVSNVTIRDLAIRGNHDTVVSNDSCYPILISSCDNLKINRVKVTYSRTMGMAVRSSSSVDISDCVVQYCARDGINTANCCYVQICNNRIEFCDDDAIGAHSQIYGVADRGYVISGNIIRFCQGIRSLGAISIAISGNTLEFCMSQGISVQSIRYTPGALEGITAGVGITITGNTIKNCIDRAIVDNLNQGSPYIVLGGDAQQAGSLSAIPGENVTGTASVISPYPYFGNVRDTDTSLPVPANYMVVVSGNTFVRDIPDSGLLSALGYGVFYTRTGSRDCTLTTAAVRQPGVLFRDGIQKGANISGNTIMGIGAATYLSASTRLFDTLVVNNIVFDCSTALSVSSSNTANHSCSFVGNVIDLDPFMLSSNRGSNGTFLALGSPQAFLIQNARGFALIGNIFRNLCRVSDYDITSAANLAGTANFVSGNIIECDPSAWSFSTSNKGVGQVPRGSSGFVIRVVDSDPGSSTYGNVLNNCPVESSSMPTSGKYITGHIVKNTAPAVSGSAGSQYIVLGWVRITVGSAHVLNTDWRELRCLTGT